jgi:hypothetical protein
MGAMVTWAFAVLLALMPQLALSPPAQASASAARAADAARTGWDALARKDPDAAAAAFRTALEFDPKDARALTGAGVAAQLLGHPEEARDLFTRAVQANPRLIDPYGALGRLEYAQGNLARAIEWYEKFVALAPDDASAVERLAAWKKEATLHDSLLSQPAGRFTILFEGETQQAIANRVSEVLEASYYRVGRALNAFGQDTVTVILYTGEQFRDITQAPAWAGGAYDGRIRIPVGGALNRPQELDRVVIHEFVHSAIRQVYPRTPKWLNEGLATYFEPGDHTALLRRLRGADAQIPLVRLNQAFQTSEGSDAAVAYAEAFAATSLLADKLGDRLPVLLQYLNEGMSVDEALLLFNLQVTDLEQAWTRRDHH